MSRFVSGSCVVRVRFVSGSCPLRVWFVFVFVSGFAFGSRLGSCLVCPVRVRFGSGSCPVRVWFVSGCGLSSYLVRIWFVFDHVCSRLGSCLGSCLGQFTRYSCLVRIWFRSGSCLGTLVHGRFVSGFVIALVFNLASYLD